MSGPQHPRARRDTLKVPPPVDRFVEVWLTRDSGDSGLYPYVDVWCVLPERTVDHAGAYWGTGDSDDQVGRYSLEKAVLKFRTVPDDDRQCVRLFTRGA